MSPFYLKYRVLHTHSGYTENMIDYGNGRYRHFTVREAARLMDFDDEYGFPGSWSDGLKQLGNAVPVTMSHAFGLSMHAALAA